MQLKKYLNISAAICSIVFGALLIIGSIQLLSMLNAYEGELTETGKLLKPITIGLIVFSLAVIVISILCIVKSSSKGNGLKIALISLMAILAILEIIGGSFGWGFICLIPVGLEIASIAVKESKPETVVENKQEQAEEAKPEIVVEDKKEEK